MNAEDVAAIASAAGIALPGEDHRAVAAMFGRYLRLVTPLLESDALLVEDAVEVRWDGRAR